MLLDSLFFVFFWKNGVLCVLGEACFLQIFEEKRRRLKNFQQDVLYEWYSLSTRTSTRTDSRKLAWFTLYVAHSSQKKNEQLIRFITLREFIVKGRWSGPYTQPTFWGRYVKSFVFCLVIKGVHVHHKRMFFFSSTSNKTRRRPSFTEKKPIKSRTFLTCLPTCDRFSPHHPNNVAIHSIQVPAIMVMFCYFKSFDRRKGYLLLKFI